MIRAFIHPNNYICAKTKGVIKVKPCWTTQSHVTNKLEEKLQKDKTQNIYIYIYPERKYTLHDV